MNETQNDQILTFLNQGCTLTPLRALHLFGCFRLGARIHELRRLGHRIESEMVETENHKRVAQYSLAKPAAA